MRGAFSEKILQLRTLADKPQPKFMIKYAHGTTLHQNARFRQRLCGL